MWYFKGRRKKYKSPYTGKEVDEAVGKALANTKNYIHRIAVGISSYMFDIICNVNEPFTASSLNSWLNENGYADESSGLPIICSCNYTVDTSAAENSLTISNLTKIWHGTSAPQAMAKGGKISITTEVSVSPKNSTTLIPSITDKVIKI